jgi:hypothetical protein
MIATKLDKSAESGNEPGVGNYLHHSRDEPLLQSFHPKADPTS